MPIQGAAWKVVIVFTFARTERSSIPRKPSDTDHRPCRGKPTAAEVMFVLVFGAIVAVVPSPRGIGAEISTTPPAAAARSRCRDRHRFPSASACDCRAETEWQ